MSFDRRWVGVILTGLISHFGAPLWGANTGELEIRIVDSADMQLIPARMHLKDHNGKPVKIPKTIAWNDHFVVPGVMVLELRPGKYTFELERGPEYKLRSGHFELKRADTDSKTIEMNRFVDMKKEGWYSGDLRVKRPIADLPLLMRAEDLYVVPNITWTNQTNLWKEQPIPEVLTIKTEDDRYYNVMAGADERPASSLWFGNLSEPLALPGDKSDYPPAAELLRKAKETGGAAFVDLDRSISWDLPMLVATGQLDSVGICHAHMHRNGLIKNEAGGRPRDEGRFRDEMGIGKYTIDVYYQLLNCGLRIPPSAGSYSGTMPNPPGYNRMYVHCGEDFSYDEWFANFREGRVIVTNGPMMRPLVNGKYPGYVFEAPENQKVQLSIALNLSMREKVDYLEIVKDGRVLHEVRLDELAKAGGKLPEVEFDESGWMVIRAVTNHPETFRFAMCAPYYVEIGYKKKVSKKAAQFFLDWVYARARQVAQIPDAEQRSAVMADHKAARDFWQKKVEEANAE